MKQPARLFIGIILLFVCFGLVKWCSMQTGDFTVLLFPIVLVPVIALFIGILKYMFKNKDE